MTPLQFMTLEPAHKEMLKGKNVEKSPTHCSELFDILGTFLADCICFTVKEQTGVYILTKPTKNVFVKKMKILIRGRLLTSPAETQICSMYTLRLGVRCDTPGTKTKKRQCFDTPLQQNLTKYNYNRHVRDRVAPMPVLGMLTDAHILIFSCIVSIDVCVPSNTMTFL